MIDININNCFQLSKNNCCKTNNNKPFFHKAECVNLLKESNNLQPKIFRIAIENFPLSKFFRVLLRILSRCIDNFTIRNIKFNFLFSATRTK